MSGLSITWEGRGSLGVFDGGTCFPTYVMNYGKTEMPAA